MEDQEMYDNINKAKQWQRSKETSTAVALLSPQLHTSPFL